MNHKATPVLHLVINSSVYRQDNNFNSLNLKQLIEFYKYRTIQDKNYESDFDIEIKIVNLIYGNRYRRFNR